MFNKDSGLVKIWIRRVLNGATIEEVPNISNLREIVQQEIEKTE